MDEQTIIQEINALQWEHDGLTIPKAELNEILSWYLEQLQKRGATLEDCVCGVLRKLIYQCDLRERIDEKKAHLRHVHTILHKEFD